MKDREFKVNSVQVILHVSRSNCSSYDCEFITLAKDLDVNMVTLDKQILKEFSGVAVHPGKVVS